MSVEVDDEHDRDDGAATLLRSPVVAGNVTDSDEPPQTTERRVLVHNPASGTTDEHDEVRSLASERGYDVRETTSAEDIVETAATAAKSADVVGAAGGDGTLTRVVRGFDRVDAFDDTLFGVVPAGTGNNFATNVGITGIEHGFDVIDDGERRRIDLGLVDGVPFLNSCVAGLTAEASAETEPSAKERWGPVAYALATAETARDFRSLHLTVRPAEGGSQEFDATIVLVGNARGFPRTGRTQANVEDGLLEVTIIEDVSTLALVEESVQTALGGEAEHVRQLKTTGLDVEIRGTPNRISVDGEIQTASHLSFGVRERTLWLPVGDAYEPEPADSRE